jgi:alkylation response protein AidB-like acyl-CoA dehydrogenase
MDLRFTPEERAFRDEVRAFLRDNLREEIRQRMIDGEVVNKADLVEWSRILNAHGWAVYNWPKEWGGYRLDARAAVHLPRGDAEVAAPQPLAFNTTWSGR